MTERYINVKNKIHFFVLGAEKNLLRVSYLFVSVWMTKISTFANNSNGFFLKENTDSLHPQITLNTLVFMPGPLSTITIYLNISSSDAMGKVFRICVPSEEDPEFRL